jgi:hypothetical protein
MTSFKLVPKIRDILDYYGNNRDRDSDDDIDDDIDDIRYLEKIVKNYYVDSAGILYYKPDIFRYVNGYNNQTYLQDRFGNSGKTLSSTIIPKLSVDNRQKARLKSRGIVNMGDTCFANSLFQMLSYIPEWYVLLDNSDVEYMKELKILYDQIKDKSLISTPIKFNNMIKCLKKIYDGYEESKQDDPKEFLMKILDDHKQFKIFDLIEETIIECTYGERIVEKNTINTSKMLLFNTVDNSSVLELVTNNKETVTDPDQYLKRCKKNESDIGPGPFTITYKYNFLDTMYLIILLKRSGVSIIPYFDGKGMKHIYKTYMTKHDIFLDYNLNIQETKFTLEGFIVKTGDKNNGHYIYVKILEENKYIVHDDDKPVYEKNDNHNTDSNYRRGATILLYKKSLK